MSEGKHDMKMFVFDKGAKLIFSIDGIEKYYVDLSIDGLMYLQKKCEWALNCIEIIPE